MSTVKLGRTGSTVVVDLEVCVKTGLPTRETVTINGSTTPPWVSFLLLITVLGYLFASAMASQKFRVTLPFTHAVYDRWKQGRRRAWLLGIVGLMGLVLALVASDGDAGAGVGASVVVIVVALVVGMSNGRRHGVGIVATRHDDLVVTRVHPSFAAAVRESVAEPLVG
ncbi:hypothetical protein [Nocardioides plantarum]|uniref:Uncharacterized protein n=1 Tax=Nocardioides plantarum TaxID=29299 RepID=A0ABV5KIS4_9ACTN|nr:hypothetical protein [Nocardioides plantarum]